MAFSIAMVFSCSLAGAADKASGSAARFLKNPQKGGLEFKSIGRLSFGPDGLLLLSDPQDASVLAINTGDTGPLVKLGKKIDNVEIVLAKALAIEPAALTIVDMAVNPASGRIYFSLTTKPGNKPALVAVDGKGGIHLPDMETMEYVRMTLPVGENAKLRNVTDLAWADYSVVVAGQSSEELSNKIYQLPIPLEHGVNARYFSAETYHVSHKRWETNAQIQSFIPYEEDGELFVVGAFACTPIAKFPLGEIEDLEEVKGVSVVELGSGNRPLDMFTYKKDGQDWLITSNKRFHKKFGPSVYWGARVDMKYLSASDANATNENAPRRNLKQTSGPDAKGIEVVDSLYGAVQISQLENDEVVVLRETDESDTAHSLELVTLP
jgi:hypothetical protein